MKELTNPDAACLMEERHRVRVEALLRSAASDRAARLLAGAEEEEEEEEEEEGGEEWAAIQRQLLRSGFTPAHCLQARAGLSQSQSLSRGLPRSLPAYLDWLCLHLPEPGETDRRAG